MIVYIIPLLIVPVDGQVLLIFKPVARPVVVVLHICVAVQDAVLPPPVHIHCRVTLLPAVGKVGVLPERVHVLQNVLLPNPVALYA